LAVREEARQVLLEQLELTANGERAEYGETLFTGLVLPSGWFILFINQCEHEFLNPKVLATISIHCDVVGCSVEEHVMWCSAQLWHHREQVWRVAHDAQKHISHLEVSGLLPDAYGAIESQFAKQQLRLSGGEPAADYYFEIPLDLAKSVVGFKHDEPGTNEKWACFDVVKLKSSRPVTDRSSDRKSKWKFW